MLRSMLFAVAVSAIVGPGVITTEAMAGSSNGREQDAHAAAYSMPQRWQVAHRPFAHGFGVGPAAYYGYAVGPRASAFGGPGPIYVPGFDEACNLPTSRCSNYFRNVN